MNRELKKITEHGMKEKQKYLRGERNDYNKIKKEMSQVFTEMRRDSRDGK